MQPERRSQARAGRQRYMAGSTTAPQHELTLRSTVAVLFLALVRCRVPLTLGDLRRCVCVSSADAAGSRTGVCRT